MSTANEILMLRSDTMRDIDRMTKAFEREVMPDLANRLFGMHVQVVPDHMKDILTTKHYSIEKLPGKKRRKGYRVKCERRPCAFVINRSALDFSPFNMRIDF
jgi:hypothetical protein